MPKKTSRPTKQHTVPDFYLKRFADANSMLWVYDREKKELRKQPTKDTTIERDFYTFQVRHKGKDYSIETDLFAKNVEKNANLVIEKVDKGELPNLKDRQKFCEFIAFQYLRTTALRREVSYSFEEMSKLMLRMNFQNVKRASKTIKDFEKKKGKKFGVKPEEMVKFVKEGKYDIKAPKEYHLNFMLRSFNEFYSIFIQLNWVFVRTSGRRVFVTSDNPLVVVRFGAKPFVPFHISQAETTIPLSSKVCLYMHKYGGGTLNWQADDKIVNNFNLRTIVHSDRYIISRKRKQLLELTKTSKIDQIPRRPMFKFESPF